MISWPILPALISSAALCHFPAIHREVGSLPDGLVLEWTLHEIQLIVPVVRIGVRDDLHAGGFELGNRVGRRRLDQIDLAGEQSRSPRRRLRHRQ